MPDFFVQYRRQLVAAPTVGKWDIYSGAWFNAANLAAVVAQHGRLEWLFLGVNGINANQYNISDTRVFVQTAGFSSIKIWENVGGLKVPVSDVGRSVPTAFSNSATSRSLPAQCSICVGYRSTVGTNTRAGRSRFFIGPLHLGVDYVTNTPIGNLRLNAAGVDSVKTGAENNLAALAAAGLTLRVRSGTFGAYTFADATEVYVDDVFDIQRRRRPWSSEQDRFWL